jgi:dihydropteroate synthase
MGVLNVTPDSFSDGGRFFDPQKAIEHALECERAGADILDIGGESTRPGSQSVSAEEEISRVLPVLKGLRNRLKIPISLDTQKSAVAEAGLKMGVAMLNDVSDGAYAHAGRTANDAEGPICAQRLARCDSGPATGVGARPQGGPSSLASDPRSGHWIRQKLCAKF